MLLQSLTGAVVAGSTERGLDDPIPSLPGFERLIPQKTRVAFRNDLGDERSLMNQVLLNGSGVAIGDVDLDGWPDLYFAAIEGSNRLYRNLGGWRFEDITEKAGVACSNYACTGVALVDLDGDRDPDLVVNTVLGGTLHFVNEGKGQFRRSVDLITAEAKEGAMSLAFADIEGDGDLDIYVANYRPTRMKDEPDMKFFVEQENGRPVIREVNGVSIESPELVGRFSLAPNGKLTENGQRDALLINDGRGHFRRENVGGERFLTETGEASQPLYDWGLSVLFRDLNQDGAPDLYVCNDFESPDRIWINNGHGRFQALDPLAIRTTSAFSMGVDVADINRDGRDDLFVADMRSRDHFRRMLQIGDVPFPEYQVGDLSTRTQYSRNTLLLGREDGKYREVGRLAGLDASEWSWSVIFLDVDLDGFEDLLMTNGHGRDFMNADVGLTLTARRAEGYASKREELLDRSLFPVLETGNLAFKNLGDVRFEDASKVWGFDAMGVSHGMATGDLDRDGDLDLVVNNLNQEALLYRNKVSRPRVAVRLQGKDGNTAGIGARIELRGERLLQAQEMVAGGRYLSSDDPIRVFAADGERMTLTVRWASGAVSVKENVGPNTEIVLDEGEARVVENVQASSSSLWFRDQSEWIQHRHRDMVVDEFGRQPSLSRRLGHEGPGVAWLDVNRDGWEDLVVGAGRGGHLSVWKNDKGQAFRTVSAKSWARPTPRDHSGIVGTLNTSGGAELIVGQSNYEDGRKTGAGGIAFQMAQNSQKRLPGGQDATGAMALADVDGDGTLELFVAGRVVAGRYPEPSSSALWSREGEGFTIRQRFPKIGLVTDARFTDVDGDGDPDLLLAREWNSLVLLINQGKRFEEASEAWGLSSHRGWWTSLAVGDFDGDGRMDFLAGNRGLNWDGVERVPEMGLRLYYGDFYRSGVVQFVEARYDQGVGDWVPLRGKRWLTMALPHLPSRFPSFAEYGKATIPMILDGPPSQVIEASEGRAMVFLNRKNKYMGRALPLEVQFSESNGIVVADFDADGKMDAFVSQNNFAVRGDLGRQDGGSGLVLRGRGDGHFSAVGSQQTGLHLYGEARGAAAADFDQDGRIDLVVGQNGAETKLYRNEGSQPGLVVRLKGSLGNPLAIGAKIRAVKVDGMGPLIEVGNAGGKYSQNGALLVIGERDRLTGIRVWWPGETQANLYPVDSGKDSVSLRNP